MTLGEKLDAANGHPSGFDYLRLALAVSVVLIHVVALQYGIDYALRFWSGWARPISGLVLPMFFTLSGFLVAGSLLRSKTVPGFLALRALRIVPALAVETILCAMILGTLFTTLPLREYFSDPLFARYFLNILGEPQFTLPGVFKDNIYPNMVNGQLWTIPWELACYAVIAVASALKLTSEPKRLLATFFIFNFYVFATAVDQWSFMVPEICLVQAFLAGLLLYVFRSTIPYSKALFVTCMALSVALFFIPYGRLVVTLPAAYVTCFLGLANPKRNGLILSGDYSYGIYLYGAPLQQSFTHLFGPGHGLASVLTVIPTAFVIAAMSRWSVEDRALRLRKYVPQLEEIWLRLRDFVVRRVTPARAEAPAE